jgi:hypothetical protein
MLVITLVNTVSDPKCLGGDRRSLRKQLRAPQGVNADATTNFILDSNAEPKRASICGLKAYSLVFICLLSNDLPFVEIKIGWLEKCSGQRSIGGKRGSIGSSR